MALKIITYYNNEQPLTEHIWNVGDNPFKWVELIRWIEADGDELKYIENLFDLRQGAKEYTIPMPRKGIAKFYGDIAKTIIANL